MEVASPQLVDTHAHLNSPRFDGEEQRTLARAREAGVEIVIDVGTEPDEWEASLALARESVIVRCVLGLHPNSAARWSTEMAERLRSTLAEPDDEGLGETGLDYYRMGAPRETQQEVFRAHLELARETGLPVVIHARDAYDDILDTLERHGQGTLGVMHSFSGNVEQALRAVGLAHYVSISGPVTYKSGANIREAAAAVPLDRLLVETDSPYLPPQQHRGGRNEPAYVALTARAVAEVRGIAFEELARATTENARRLFRLPEWT